MNRYALIIGINEYKSDEIHPLEYAVNDATELMKILTRPGAFQIPKENLKLLINEDATHGKIIGEIHKLQEKCEEDDQVIFYYAGHGCSEEDKDGDPDDQLKKYLVPTDTNIYKLKSTAIDFSILSYKLTEIRSKQLLMLFDCCYSGAAGGRTFKIRGTRANGVNIGSNYLARLNGAGRLTLTACSGRQVATESPDLGHGIFTYYILKGLNGEADFHKDGIVDVDELWLYVDKNTANHTNDRQHPVRTGWTEKTFALSEPQIPKIESTPENRELYKHKIIERFSEYKLQEVRISDNDDISSIGATAAEYLHGKLRSNSKISVSCGSTLIETISQLPRLKLLSKIEIFPLNGSPSAVVQITDAMVLSYLLWSKFEHGKATANVVPTGVPEDLFGPVKEGIKVLAEKILSAAKDSDIFLFGIGDPYQNKNIPRLLDKAKITKEELKEMGAVGEINFLLYDNKGKLLSLANNITNEQREKVASYNSKFFSLSPEDLMEISRRPGIDLIVVAGGTSKRNALLAGIYGGFVRTLITDIYTAHWLVHDAPNYD